MPQAYRYFIISSGTTLFTNLLAYVVLYNYCRQELCKEIQFNSITKKNLLRFMIDTYIT